jgi:hypothetical protein
MTFDPGIPVKTQSPGLFPDQMHADLNRLKTIIEADHVFNTTAQVNDGVHKQVKLINRAAPVALVNGESGMHYSTANALGQSIEWWYNGVCYYPQSTTKAFVNFSGTTMVIRPGAYNIGTVVRRAGGAGRYKLNYIIPFISVANNGNYVVQVTCSDVNNTTIGTVTRDANPVTQMTNLFVNIDTVDRNGNHVDCNYIGVTVTSFI